MVLKVHLNLGLVNAIALILYLLALYCCECVVYRIINDRGIAIETDKLANVVLLKN
jgi:hypothetical protein